MNKPLFRPGVYITVSCLLMMAMVYSYSCNMEQEEDIELNVFQKFFASVYIVFKFPYVILLQLSENEIDILQMFSLIAAVLTYAFIIERLISTFSVFFNKNKRKKE